MKPLIAMNPEYERQLEASVQRELGALNDLQAPSGLAHRVLSAVEQRNAAPWYRRAWPTWSRGWQTASLVLLIGLCVGASLGFWSLFHSGAGQGTRSFFDGCLSDLAVSFKVYAVVGDAMILGLRYLGTSVIAAAIAIVILLWVAGVGIGTACVRLAMQPALNPDRN